MKTCPRCATSKPLSEFWIDRRRMKPKSYCKACDKETAQAWRARNPEHDSRRYWANKDAEQERHLVRKYGVNLTDYARMLAAQGGACAVCRAPEPQHKKFDVDHDHATGRVRGLLCTNCNRMLGHAGDKASTLRAAAAYLEAVPQVAAEFIGAYLET